MFEVALDSSPKSLSFHTTFGGCRGLERNLGDTVFRSQNFAGLDLLRFFEKFVGKIRLKDSFELCIEFFGSLPCNGKDPLEDFDYNDPLCNQLYDPQQQELNKYAMREYQNLLRLPFFSNGKDPLEDFDYNDPLCNQLYDPQQQELLESTTAHQPASCLTNNPSFTPQ
ncbi:hypothetical protein F511_34969 [Dorcoceras hygrometricum]|uniref:Uncharacterized protein n=1 Tax=Dorcoceras hygrometricum TaxID=472368 RepID=A0A2Z7D7J1_9LAMI|nr:hypothetical protein F511_34969 [Dorcoceras hygrometricum]